MNAPKGHVVSADDGWYGDRTRMWMRCKCGWEWEQTVGDTRPLHRRRDLLNRVADEHYRDVRNAAKEAKVADAELFEISRPTATDVLQAMMWGDAEDIQRIITSLEELLDVVAPSTSGWPLSETRMQAVVTLTHPEETA